MSSRSLVLAAALAIAAAWDDCEFPAVDFMMLDQSPGISYAYAVAAMNGKLYSGGYTKGNFALVGINQEHDIHPVASATLWNDVHSNEQSLYIAEVSASGSMEKSWHFEGSAIQVGELGHGPQTNSINAHSGLHKMLDHKHIAVAGGFKQRLQLPDGTTWSSACLQGEATCSGRENTKDQVPFVMKLDVSSQMGVGPGTTGWAKQMDVGHNGGGQVYSVDGDGDGNMVVSYKGCSAYDATAVGSDAYGQPTVGAPAGCKYYLAKLSASDGSEVWKVETPAGLGSCRVITDGSIFCGWSTSEGIATFEGGATLDQGEGGMLGIVKFDSTGAVQWAKSTIAGSFGDLSVSQSGALLAVVGTPPSTGRSAPDSHVARIDTTVGGAGNVLWIDQGGVGTHGFRGVEVTDDEMEVVVFGQHDADEVLSDASGATTTLRSRGSYEVYVAAYVAADGSGKYAMDGGGSGMEYFFAFAKDPDTNAIYLGGTSRSEKIQWGNIKRDNIMYNGDTSSAIGSSKAFVVKMRSTLELPSCLNSCGTVPEVKDGHCYIDRYCYASGESATYEVATCRSCDSTKDALAWSDPDTTNHCFFDGRCYPQGSKKQIRSGWSSVDSECEMCDTTHSTSAWSLDTKYELVEGACSLKDETWETKALNAGWRTPCPKAKARARQLASLKEKARKLKAERKRQLNERNAKNTARNGPNVDVSDDDDF